jgi:hypothetical protein
MHKKPKVVPIREGMSSPTASDETGHRVIFSIAGERFAIDLFSRVSRLPASGESREPNVLQLNRKSGKPGGCRG